jgi:hypothetical protein
VSRPDFEVQASLRARRLKAKVPPSGSVDADDGVELDRDESRTNLPRELDPAGTYADVQIEHKVIGRVER